MLWTKQHSDPILRSRPLGCPYVCVCFGASDEWLYLTIAERTPVVFKHYTELHGWWSAPHTHARIHETTHAYIFTTFILAKSPDMLTPSPVHADGTAIGTKRISKAFVVPATNDWPTYVCVCVCLNQ